MIQKHAHKLKRHKYRNKEEVYFCTLDDCDFKMSCKLCLGKSNICWRCGSVFEMNEISLRLAKPHCTKCTKHKGDVDVEVDMNELVAVAKDATKVREAVEKKPASTDLKSRMARMLDDVARHAANKKSASNNETEDGDII